MDDRADYAVAVLNEFRSNFAGQQDDVAQKMASGAALHEFRSPDRERHLDASRARVKLVLDEISPGWRQQLAAKSWLQSEDAFLDKFAGEQIVKLTEGAEIQTRLRSDIGTIVGQNLHEWVWTSETARRWHKDEYVDAVTEAAKSVNEHVQAKAGRDDIGETKLLLELYSDKPAGPGKPRLRFGETNQQIERDRRSGAMHFSAGWFTAIRNVLSHSSAFQLEKYRALEYLAALSILARWADEADVDAVDGTSEEP